MKNQLPTAWFRLRFCAFEVSNVHRGNFRVGQTIAVTILEPYYVSSSQDPRIGLQPLKTGSSLVLFLDRAKKVFAYDLPTNVEVYSPAPSGVRVVVGEKAVGFWQRSNPGPYEALLTGAETNVAIQMVEHLRQQIYEGIPKVEKWRPVLDAKPTTNDIPALLEILRSRKIPANYRPEDFIAEKVCGKLVDLHDLPALASAFEIQPSLLWWLHDGFRTPAGRDFIISKISDQSKTVQERTNWANMLQRVGVDPAPN